MTDAKILEVLTEIFRDTFDDDQLILTAGMTSDDIGQWDSFNHINILVTAEVRFGIKFNTSEVEGLRDVGELVQLIGRKVGR